MCSMETKRGNGKPKYSFENIHLLYTDRMVAKKYLCTEQHTPKTNVEKWRKVQETAQTDHEAMNAVLMNAFLHHRRFFSANVAR